MPLLCLLDSGATANRIGAELAELAELAGVSFDAPLAIDEIAVAGVRTTGRCVRIGLTVASHRFDAPVWFCEPWPFEFGLLGQEGFFRFFRVTFWRSAKRMELTVIEPALFAPYLEARFRETGKAIEGPAAKRLLRLTGGHPYATQELAYFTWEETPAGGTATPEHVERGLAGVLRSEHAHFSLLWERASRTQRLVLAALAAEPGRPYTAEFRRRHRLPPATNVQKALATLTKQELVAKSSRGRYAIAGPFLAEWILRTVEA